MIGEESLVTNTRREIQLKISVVIPCHNEEDTIREVVERVKRIEMRNNIEILVVDDGSTDSSMKRITKFKDVRIVRHASRCGKGEAIKTGLEKATGEIFIVQDADLEYLPENIPILTEPIIEQESDIVYGSRFLGTIKGMSLRHRIGNIVLSLMTSLLYFTRITDVMTGHKAFRIGVIKDMRFESKKFEWELEVTTKLLKKGKKILEVPIPYEYRKKGKSKIYWKDGFTTLFWLIKSKFAS